MAPHIVTAKELMTHGVVTVPANSSIARVAQILAEEKIHGAPVVDDGGGVIGVVTRSDIARFIYEVGEGETEEPETSLSEVDSDVDIAWEHGQSSLKALEGTVEDIMSPDPVMATPAATAGQLAKLMIDEGVGRVLITSGDDLLGLVSASDLLGVLGRYEEELRRK